MFNPNISFSCQVSLYSEDGLWFYLKLPFLCSIAPQQEQKVQGTEADLKQDIQSFPKK